MKASTFSRSAVALLVAAAVALFSLSILLHAYDNDPVATGNRSRPSAYSVSAIGHAGFYDVLRRTDRPVSRSVGNTLAMVGVHGTLIVAEPNLRLVSSEDGRRLLTAPRILLVLPKWRGTADAGRPAWVSAVEPMPLGSAQNTLGLVLGRGEVVRAPWPGMWKTNELGVTPAGSWPEGGAGVAQLVRSRELRPVVGTEEGMLVGELVDRNRVIWVLADPDVMANHGITKGDNAAFMVTLLDRLREWQNDDPGAPVVFDETVHGFQGAQGSPVKLLLRFPYIVVTALIVLAAVMLAFAGSSRFGAPRNSEPELDFGKAALISNSARLLDYAGYHGDVLRRYVLMTVRSTARALHAPTSLTGPSLAAWLDRVGKARNVSLSCADILRCVAGLAADDPKNLTRLFASARDIHRWKGEMLNGSTATKPVRRRDV